MNESNFEKTIRAAGYQRNYEYFQFGDVYQRHNNTGDTFIIHITSGLMMNKKHLEVVKQRLVDDYHFFVNSKDNILIIVDEPTKKTLRRFRRVDNAILIDKYKNSVSGCNISTQFQDVLQTFKEVRNIENAQYKKFISGFHDREYSYGFPAFAILVIVSCIAVFAKDVSSAEYGAIPYDILKRDQFYRVFTAMFLHADLSHIIGNMVILFFVGRSFERRFGHVAFLLSYFVGGAYSVIIAVLYYNSINEGTVIVGASGAIFALMGAEVVGAIVYKDKYLAISCAVYTVACCVAGFFSENVANSAHISGVIFGAITMLVYEGLKTAIENTRYVSAASVLRRYNQLI